MNNVYTSKNSEYLDKNPDWHISDSSWKAKQVYTLLHRNNIPFTTLAEIGCGAGEILNQLLTSYYKNTDISFYGYDISPDAFKLCQQRSKSNLSFYCEDLLEKDEIFNVLLVLDVFEHVDDYLGFIKRCKPKADYKIYHIPLDISALGVLRGVPLQARKLVNHIHYFMKDTAFATLIDSEHEIIDYFYTPVMIEVHNNRLQTKILNLFRKLIFKISPDFCVNLLGGYSIIVLTK